MIWMFITLLIFAIIIQIALFKAFSQLIESSGKKFNEAKEALDLTILQIIKFHQDLSETEEKNFGKIKEIVKVLNDQSKDLTILRKYIDSINMIIKNSRESNKELNDHLKTFSKSINELKVSKDIVKNLAEVSGNLKILDAILKKISDLKGAK